MMLTKAKPAEPMAKEGDHKTTTHFAWWPKKVKEGTVFLERYERHHQYRKRLRIHQVGYHIIPVDLPAWDIIEEKLISKCA